MWSVWIMFYYIIDTLSSTSFGIENTSIELKAARWLVINLDKLVTAWTVIVILGLFPLVCWSIWLFLTNGSVRFQINHIGLPHPMTWFSLATCSIIAHLKASLVDDFLSSGVRPGCTICFSISVVQTVLFQANGCFPRWRIWYTTFARDFINITRCLERVLFVLGFTPRMFYETSMV